MPSAEKPQRGTGLYRLKQLVEQYNGEILLNTEDGNGKNLVFFQVNV
jgi:sensor histidine kinase regulating citrate/malate metabolism